MTLLTKIAWFLLAAGTCHQAFADTTLTLPMSGSVRAPTCHWQVGDDNRTITLPTLDRRNFPASGAIGAVSFTLRLTGCSASIAAANFAFVGQSEPSNRAQFLNLGSAKGVAINLTDSAGETIRADGTGSTRRVPVTGTSAQIDLTVAYWRLAAQAVEAGDVKALSTITVTYE
ncbi:fimbrial protein [Dyella sp.]|uniref:fimbrial protein n=1 Tax=Dyella sp. TaxID=1869338 RepID=UPI002ED2123A